VVFEELLAGNMNLGRPEHAEIIFGQKVTRKTPGVFSTRLLNRGDQVTINLSFKHSRIKIYLKEDHALRVETVINSPGDLGCKRGLEHLDELSAKARACNARRPLQHDPGLLRPGPAPRQRADRGIARTNTYRLTTDGLTFALVYTRVHDQVLYSFTAHDQPIAAPAPVRAAWRTITRHIDSTVAATRLGRAA
jgi:hypothetical protein